MTIAQSMTQLAVELRAFTDAAVWLDRADVTRDGIHITPRTYPILATLGGVDGLGVTITVIGADTGEKYASESLGDLLDDVIQTMLISPDIELVTNSDGSWATATMFETRPEAQLLPAWRISANVFYDNE